MQEQERLVGADDPHDQKLSKTKSDMIFVDWLVQTFGLDRLRAAGVVDVAGGRGLADARGPPCPRRHAAFACRPALQIQYH